MSDENIFSKKGERKISTFIGQELLYDYISDHLDAGRKKAVDEFLKDNREAQGDIVKINNGLAYTEKMSTTVVSPPLIEQIKQPSSYMELVLAKIRFDQWPQGLRLGLEALLVAVGIISIALLMPWHKIMRLKLGGSDLILTEVIHNEKNTESTNEVPDKDQAPEFADEGAKQDLANVVAIKETSVSNNSPTSTTTIPVKAVATNSAPPKTAEADKAVVAAEVAGASEAKRQGFLYRATISVTNVAAVSEKLAEGVVALGGRKAGDVELGWKRGDGSYFHFTIPESKYQEILTLFGEYGTLKINKEKHERIMPEGIIRLIINVDEKKSGT